MDENGIMLAEETALRVKQLEVKFGDFETQNKMSDCYFNELDEELEEGRVSLEKLEKRVTVLETDLPELFEERLATLKTENAELRIHLNLVVDMVNNITRVLNKTFNNNNEPADEAMLQDPTIDTTSPHTDNEPTDEAIVVDDEPATEDNEPMQLTQDEWNDLLRI